VRPLSKCIAMGLCGVLQVRRRLIPLNMPQIALSSSTNRAIPYFLVLPGRKLSITEITEYKYFSLSKPSLELKYKESKILYNWFILLKPFYFCEIIFKFYYTRVGPSAIAPFLGVGGIDTHHLSYQTCDNRPTPPSDHTPTALLSHKAAVSLSLHVEALSGISTWYFLVSIILYQCQDDRMRACRAPVASRRLCSPTPFLLMQLPWCSFDLRAR